MEFDQLVLWDLKSFCSFVSYFKTVLNWRYQDTHFQFHSYYEDKREDDNSGSIRPMVHENRECGSLDGVSGVQNSNRTFPIKFQTYIINTTIPKVASQKNDCNLWTKRSV